MDKERDLTLLWIIAALVVYGFFFSGCASRPNLCEDMHFYSCDYLRPPLPAMRAVFNPNLK